MTRNYYRTGNYKQDHSTYGGIINFSDFCTDYNRSKKSKSWAERIGSEWKCDEECRKNAENTIRRRNYKKGITI